jgi:hypothetical protein
MTVDIARMGQKIIQKPEENSCGDLRRGWEYNIKMNFQEI